MTGALANTLTDDFGRRIRYLRLSITDRCDLRCRYCMAEDMQFLPRSETLTRAELLQIAEAFVALGVDKIRVTGGEPLVRADVVDICHDLRGLPRLNELALTTNGMRLAQHAQALAEAGVDTLNISLDSLHPERFRQLTRVGQLEHVLAGVQASASGFKRRRLNVVALAQQPREDLLALLRFAIEQRMDIAFIEEMPLGQVGRDRQRDALSSETLLGYLQTQFTLLPALSQAVAQTAAGPARYWALPAHPHTRVGFISPHSHNFCASCNRVRVTADGRLLLCLGHDHAISLRDVVRDGASQRELQRVIIEALHLKPQSHLFDLASDEQLVRFMNASGG